MWKCLLDCRRGRKWFWGRSKIQNTSLRAPPRGAKQSRGSMSKQYFVYLMTNQRNTVIYTGITSDLFRRVGEHKSKTIKGFTKKYNIDKLLHYEVFCTPEEAILREKQIKGGSRKKKMELIKKHNPEFKDLSV